MIRNLTEGKPETVLWKFSIPMFISVIFQQIYSISDSVIAGRFAGENALAAVGASYPITMIFMAIAIGSNIGCSVVISQLFGAKKIEEMKTAIMTTLTTSVVLSVVLTVIGLACSRLFMIMIRTPEEVFDDGALYLQIYIAGFLFLFIYNIATGIFTSLGDSKTPLYFLIGSSIGNVVLDILFVAGFGWGVAGVAWATFIAQGAACILATVTLFKRLREIKTDKKYKRFSMRMLGKISIIAVPSILQQSFISIGNIFIQGLINGFGSSAIAGYSAAIKLNTFTITSFTTLGNGLSSFTAQNIGAGRRDRVEKGYKAGVKLALIVAVPFVIAYFVFSKPLLLMFMKSSSTNALEVGEAFLKIVSPFYLIALVKLMSDGVLRGAGKMKYFMISTFLDLGLRVILSFILVIPFKTTGIWMTWPIGWTISAVLSAIFAIRGVIHEKPIIDERMDENA